MVLRFLTSGEINLLRGVSREMLPYERLRISRNEPFPDDIFFNDYSVVPFDRPYFSIHVYSDDFSNSIPSNRRHFVHEMTHVWQYYHGITPFWERVLNPSYWFCEYDYTLLEDKAFFSYNIEQQASIVADYYGLLSHASRRYTINLPITV